MKTQKDAKIYGVFNWRNDGRYPESISVCTPRSEKRAERAAKEMNAANCGGGGGGYVVREIRK